MKMIWTILIGMIVFQSLFVSFAPFFTSPGSTEGLEEISTSTEGYENMSLSNAGNLLGEIVGFGSGLFGQLAGWLIAGLTIVGVVGLILLKNFTAAGMVIFIGFITWLYGKTAGLFMHLNNQLGGSLFVTGLIGLFGVILAMLVIIAVINVLSPGVKD